MFIAHLPAGYIGACLLERNAQKATRRRQFIAFMIGSVFPDLDMLYFYLVDQGRHLHHGYWTHLPVFWLTALAIWLVVALVARSKAVAMVGIAFVAGVFLHLLLDTPFGGISWLYPLSDHSYSLVTVPATRSWWVWSFVFHWTFLFEVAICVAAAVLYFVRRRRSRV